MKMKVLYLIPLIFLFLGSSMSMGVSLEETSPTSVNPIITVQDPYDWKEFYDLMAAFERPFDRVEEIQKLQTSLQTELYL